MEKTEEKKVVTEQDTAHRILKKCKEIAEKDFAKFSALFVAFMTVGLWVIKGMWYAYQSGRLSVYRIDSCYIVPNDESFWLQIIQMMAVLVVWIGINYLYYKISALKDETKFHWRRKLKLVVFWISEMFLLFIVVIITSGINCIELIKDSTAKSVAEMLFVLACTCFVVNIYGIEFTIEKKLANRKKKKLGSKIEKKEDIDNKDPHKKNDQSMMFMVVITVALEILLMYILGVVYENDRCSYKVVLVEQEASEDNEYIFRYQDGQMNYAICPIVFENNDYYILTRLHKVDGKIEIEYAYQKIIEKIDVETFKFENIYRINMGE